MQFTLSRSAHILLIRGISLVFALGSLYGIWDNREFFLLSPFYFIAFIDFSFAILFLYFVFSFKSVVNETPQYLLYGILAFWAYTISAGIIGSIVRSQSIGLIETARIAGGYTVPTFILSELLYVVLLPSIMFLFILYFLRTYSRST